MTSTISTRETSAVRAALTVFAALTTVLSAGAASADHPDRLDGTLRVVNERMSPVVLAIDGERVGHLPPGATRHFTGIPNGVRVVRVDGPDADRLTARVAVPISKVTTYRVEALMGRAALVNDSGVTMRLALDQRPIGRLRDGESLDTGGLRAGSHELVATPVGHRGPALRSTVRVVAGRSVKVSTGRWLATLRVTNTTDRPARLAVDGKRERRLMPGETVTLAALAPGAHDLALMGRRETFAKARIDLDAGEHESWTPVVRRTGDLRISNDAHRPARVEVDGRHVARLDAGESRLLRDLPAGLHTVTAVYPRGRSRTWTVRVERREVARLSMAPAHGRPSEYVATNSPTHRR